MMEPFDIYQFEQGYSNGRCEIREEHRTLVLFERKDYYGKLILPDAPEMVGRQITYFPDTLTVQCEGEFLKGYNVQIGIWTTYDRFGEVVREDNMDKGYAITWNELRGILLAEGIRFNEVQHLYRQNNEDNKAVWLAIVKHADGTMESVTVDGQSGEILERKAL